MNLDDQARVAHDQLVLNRMAQACVAVALEKRGPNARRVLSDPTIAAQKAARILATRGDEWLFDDEILRAELREMWRKWASP